MLALKLIGCIVLALLTTLGIGYVFLYSLSKSLDWFEGKGYLPRAPSVNTNNECGDKREDADYSIYSHYILQIARRFQRGASHVFYIYTQYQDKKRYHPDSETNPKGSTHTKSSSIYRVFSQSHISNIINWLRRRVNQSGKEPEKNH
jgi:hypothetical protein